MTADRGTVLETLAVDVDPTASRTDGNADVSWAGDGRLEVGVAHRARSVGARTTQTPI